MGNYKFQPSAVSTKPSASSGATSPSSSAASPKSTAAEEKYMRNPDLANVKWSDNELRDHIEGNLKTLDEKYDKTKYENMSRKDLEQSYAKIHSQAEKQEKKDNKDKSAKSAAGDKYDKLSRNELDKAIEKELGHKLDKKYDNMSKNELRNELASLKDKDNKQEKKQENKNSKDNKDSKDSKDKSAKSAAGDQYEKLSRNELEKAIEKELGHKLDNKYEKMSKNELSKELSSLKEKDKKSTKSDPADKYENMSRKELRDAIAKEKGQPLNDHYNKMSKNELAKELATLKEEKGGNRKANSNSPESWSNAAVQFFNAGLRYEF